MMFPSKELWVALTLMESLVSAATPMLIAYRVVDAVCYFSREWHLLVSPDFTLQSPIFFHVTAVLSTLQVSRPPNKVVNPRDNPD